MCIRDRTGNEGCLSAPNLWEEVERPNVVTVKAQDRSGKEFTITGSALLARAFCHETDHLDGILFIDHVKQAPKHLDAVSYTHLDVYKRQVLLWEFLRGLFIKY